MNPQEMVGKKFGAVKVLKYMGKLQPQIYMLKCKCDCGEEYFYKYYTYHGINPKCSQCRLKERMKIEYKGKKMFLKDIAKELNINISTLKNRIYKCNWNQDRWREPIKRRNK